MLKLTELLLLGQKCYPTKSMTIKDRIYGQITIESKIHLKLNGLTCLITMTQY